MILLYDYLYATCEGSGSSSGVKLVGGWDSKTNISYLTRNNLCSVKYTGVLTQSILHQSTLQKREKMKFEWTDGVTQVQCATVIIYKLHLSDLKQGRFCCLRGIMT